MEKQKEIDIFNINRDFKNIEGLSPSQSKDIRMTILIFDSIKLSITHFLKVFNDYSLMNSIVSNQGMSYTSALHQNELLKALNKQSNIVPDIVFEKINLYLEMTKELENIKLDDTKSIYHKDNVKSIYHWLKENFETAKSIYEVLNNRAETLNKDIFDNILKLLKESI